MKNMIIGVLGGMGTYATIQLFKQYAEIFEAEKEWDRPRIIIDNRCTMPSRVRAFLYGEKTDQLVYEIIESIENLIHAGCNRIILDCNTSHLFLPKVYMLKPELKMYILDIISICANTVFKDGIKDIYLLGTEGTIISSVYQDVLKQKGVYCHAPCENEYRMIRECIEAVKQNKYTDIIKETFLKLVQRYRYCILGCTELPVLYDMYKREINDVKIYDPIWLSLSLLKEECFSNLYG